MDWTEVENFVCKKPGVIEQSTLRCNLLKNKCWYIDKLAKYEPSR